MQSAFSQVVSRDNGWNALREEERTADWESSELLALAQEAGGVGIFEWHIASGRVRLSPQFVSLYGLNEFDGRYETWLACLFREDVARIRHAIDETFETRAKEFQAEFRINRQSDQALRWIEARCLIFYATDDSATRMVGVNVDVTERKRSLVQLRSFTETLEERVKERTRALETEFEARQTAERLLRQAQKMEAVGQLTGGIAHDFNNLLTIVLGGLDAIGRQLPNLGESAAVAKISRGRDMALDGARRAVTLTNRLLAFARQQPLDPKPVDANVLVGGVCEFLRRALGEAVSLETVLAGGLWRCFCDLNQLENALINLAVNARDAMPGGGKLTIETSNCHLDEAYVRALDEPVEIGQYVMIAVADTGTGMDKDTVEKAFEPFFTTKEVGKGTGLGLSQVYGFVRQSSGHVRIYSEVGEGTTVKIYLPRHTGTPEQTGSNVQLRNLIGAMGVESILVVEDDPALRAYTVEILTDLGYRVYQASSGEAALKVIEEELALDLLFTDVVMPGKFNGRQLADEAVRRRPRLKVLFTTGYTRNAIVHHGRLDAGRQLISKPFTASDLSAKIRSVLDSP